MVIGRMHPKLQSNVSLSHGKIDVINSAYGILQSVKNGLGIASLADFIAKDHPDLIEVLPDFPFPVIQTFLTYPKQLANSKRVIAFQKFIKEQTIQ